MDNIIDCGFDCVDGKYVPTIKIFLDPCLADDNNAWERRDSLARKIKVLMSMLKENEE